jgi:hypothetical protein
VSRAVVAAALVLLVTPVRAAEPFDGRWAANSAGCGANDASAVMVDSRSLRWREAACAIRTSYLVRGAWHIRARCWTEGAVASVPIRLALRGDRLLLDWPQVPPQELRRCP